MTDLEMIKLVTLTVITIAVVWQSFHLKTV